MKMTNAKKCLSFFLCIVLIAVMALLTTGCSGNKETPDESNSELSSNAIRENISVEAISGSESVAGNNAPNDETKNSFTFIVTHNDGTQKTFTINTDKTKVGEALLTEGIIAGEEGPYGLYVKTVDGETLDYAKDGKYWAFYVDGNYSATGADMTDITDGAKYEFRAEQ